MVKYLFLSIIFGAFLAFGGEKKACPVGALRNQHKAIEGIRIPDNPNCHFSATVAHYQTKVPVLLDNYNKLKEQLTKEVSEEKRQQIERGLSQLFNDLKPFIADGAFILDARGTKVCCTC
jgi:C4-dicarboxylate-specific signal transduction histidine kinase